MIPLPAISAQKNLTIVHCARSCPERMKNVFTLYIFGFRSSCGGRILKKILNVTFYIEHVGIMPFYPW